DRQAAEECRAPLEGGHELFVPAEGELQHLFHEALPAERQRQRIAALLRPLEVILRAGVPDAEEGACQQRPVDIGRNIPRPVPPELSELFSWVVEGASLAGVEELLRPAPSEEAG